MISNIYWLSICIKHNIFFFKNIKKPINYLTKCLLKKYTLFLIKKKKLFFFLIKNKVYLTMYILFSSIIYHLFYLSVTNQVLLFLYYILIVSFFYLLISGFFYFLKYYKYSRYTSFIQDFWRNSFTVFWLVEVSLLIVIIYSISLEPLLPIYFYRNELKLGSEFIQYISFYNFIIKHIPLMFLVFLTNKESNKLTNLELSIYNILITYAITYILIDEFFLFYHITNVYMRETSYYILEQKKWDLSHNQFWRIKLWVSYFGICIFIKFIHVLFFSYFILLWLGNFIKNSRLLVNDINLKEASNENIKAAANFNLVTLYIWVTYYTIYPILNKNLYLLYTNSFCFNKFYIFLQFILKETYILYVFF